MSGSAPVNERIAARRAEVRGARRRARLRRTTTILAVLLVIVGAVALERSSLVALASLEVVGTERLAPDEVRAAAGIEVGTSVLRIRTGRVGERVAALPLVERVTVERDGPLGLVVTVTEVAPALTVAYGDTTVLVDAAGLVLGEGTAAGTLVVRLPGDPPPAGSTIVGDDVLATAHSVLLGLPGPIEALVTGARADADGVQLELDTGTVVRWGDDTRADEKARALGAVLEDLGDTSVTAIDVRAPSAPTVAP